MRLINKKQALSMLGLVLATIIWGGGFVITKRAVDEITPVYLMAFRFTIAGIAMMIFFFPKLRQIKKSDLFPGIVLGVWLAVSFITQTYGIKYTTASKNAFITTFYVILVPFFNIAYTRAKPRIMHLAASAVAIVGLALLSLDSTFRVSIGDSLTLLCSACYAIHIVLLGRYAKNHDAVILTMLQMFAAAILCLICAPIMEGPPPGLSVPLVSGILYLALLSTMLGFLFQTIGQKHLPTTLVSILLTMECVFGAAFSILFLGDPMTPRVIAGFVLMFGAILASVLSG